ncbi:Synaptotagmin [Entamoeba marina]
MEVKLCLYSANGIKAADLNGKSDGYVKFKTSGSKQMKTKVADPSLNPVWNQTFSCKVNINEKVVFNVFDHDRIGKDDPLGDAIWTVPPMLNGEVLNDVLPISEGGFLKITVTVVSGGVPHRQPDVVGPQMKTIPTALKVGILSARNIKKKDVLDGTNDAYCVMEIFKKKMKTRILELSVNPTWNEYFYIAAPLDETIKFTVYDHDRIGKDDEVGHATMFVPDLSPSEKVNYTVQINTGGQLNISLESVRSIYQFAPENYRPTTQIENDQVNQPYDIAVTIVKATHLRAADIVTSDPYVKVKTPRMKKEKKTSVKKLTCNPEWNETILVRAMIGEVIDFHVFDQDRKNDDSLGTASLKVKKMPINGTQKEELILSDKGSLHVSLQRIRGMSSLASGYILNAPAQPQGGFMPGAVF